MNMVDMDEVRKQLDKAVKTHRHDVKEREAVVKELAALMNKYGWDDWFNTPDYLLAEFIVDAVRAYGRTMNRNMLWHSGWNPLGGENKCTDAWYCVDDIHDDAGQVK